VNVHPKLAASVTGMGAGGALTVVVVWLLSLRGVTVPDDVAQALTILFGAGLAFVAGYITPSGEPAGAIGTENPPQAPQGQKAQ
jgi:hypothetical protein